MNMRLLGATLALGSLAAGSLHADNSGQVSASLSGYEEVPLAINSPGSGRIQMSIDDAAATISYTLSYSGVSSPVTQAHIHFGQRHVTGGVLAFLCSNLPNAPAGIPACPQFEGSVSGTISAGNVLPLEQQNVAAGDFRALVNAIAGRAVYANVHTTRFPAGELRGQLKHGHKGDSAQR